MENEFRHKDIWLRIGPNFSVEISRHSALNPLSYSGGNIWCVYDIWCVYAYVMQTHPLFETLSEIDPKMYSHQIYKLEIDDLLHGGCTFFEKNVHEDYFGKREYIKLGADYNHLGDERFTFDTSLDSTNGVLYDANQLFNYLASKNTEPGD